MDLSLQNPWWKNPNVIEDDEKVEEALNKKQKVTYPFNLTQNTLVLGPRQVGKTTMLKLFIHDLIKRGVNPRDILYFSCEPLSKKQDIIEVFSDFDRISIELKGRKYLFLDEVTQIKDWELAIKYFLETKLSKNKILVTTGSNALLLKKGLERLPGRDLNVRLFLPLSFREFLLNFASRELKQELRKSTVIYEDLMNMEKLNSMAVKLSPFLDEINARLYIYLKTGGYLKPIYELLENNYIREETYEIYVKWILGDLSRLDKRESIFKSMVKGVIKNYCSKFSLLSFAKEMEIPSHVTVSEYLEGLQSLLLVNNLYQVDLSKKLPIFRKERKCYFIDPFLYNVFKGYSLGRYQDYSEDSEDKLLQGVVCEALARLNRQYLDITHFLWFYTKKKETDFVLKIDNSLTGIELKFKDKVEKRDFSNLYSFKDRILLSKKDLSFEDNLLIMPTGLFLSLV
ncbi:MAG: hypothetical protein B6U72_05830 [Candidatus Altiarchaeales archaeon ex4484_2]|nr:MAG: hypothetical protein B6U72_05830 [Candidatus Altiarchaeales archaeon ex4484_2]